MGGIEEEQKGGGWGGREGKREKGRGEVREGSLGLHACALLTTPVLRLEHTR